MEPQPTACRIWNWPARPTTANIGDWVCVGAKVKGQIGLNPGSGFGNLGFTNNPGSPIIDGDFNGTGGTALSTNKKAGPYYDEWHDSINCGKVTAHPWTYGTNLDLFSDGKHHTYVAYPWLAVFSSATFSDDDVLYLKRFGLRNVRPTNTLGAYNFPAPITVPKITLSGAGATGKVACIKPDKSLGYCSTQPDSTGSCTCN